MRRFATGVAALFSAAILAGGSLYAQTVSISPGYINIPLGGTQQYTATVTGLSPATVTWGVTAGGGTITQTGLYTAPSKAPSSALISATSTANPKIQAVVYVNPEAPGPVITAMSPSPLPIGSDTITITASAATPFIAGAYMVCGGAVLNTKVISPTSISAGDYVGASPSTLTCYVVNPGFWQSNSLTVPVNPVPPTPAPVVSPSSASVALGATQQFSASNVTSWSATAGTISSAGLFTAPAATTATGKVTVTATGPGGSGSATVTLTVPPAPVLAPSTATVALERHRRHHEFRRTFHGTRDHNRNRKRDRVRDRAGRHRNRDGHADPAHSRARGCACHCHRNAWRDPAVFGEQCDDLERGRRFDYNGGALHGACLDDRFRHGHG